MIRRCNDFGAGGVSVAVGELAPGLDINLDAVPKKYEGLNLFNNPFIESTPYKMNNTNLDKMFFSVIQNDYENTPIKKI